MNGVLNRMRFWQRLLLYLLPFLIVPVGVLGYLVVDRWSTDLETYLSDLERTNLEVEEVELSQYFQTVEDDIRFMADRPATTQLAAALASGDPERIANGLAYASEAYRQTSLTSNIEIVNPDAGISFTRPIYNQVRFIDTAGNEIVRVDRTYGDPEENIPVIVPDDQLQNKADTDYFLETAELDANEVYVSPLSLNREGTDRTIQVLPDGTVVPVIRYGMPVYVDNELIGVVVMNVFAQSMLDLVTGADLETATLLINESGYYLYNSINPNLTFGFEDGIETVFGQSDVSVYNDPDAVLTEAEFDAILRDEQSSLQSLDTANNYLAHYVEVKPPSADYAWTLVTAQDRATLFSDVQSVVNFGLLGLLAVVAISGTGLFLISRYLTQPIRHLSAQAQRMASGDLSLDETANRAIAQDREDEIGELNKSFYQMARQLRELFTSMEDRIKARTNDLETSAEIAGAANQVRDIDDLLSLTVNLIRDRFNFYYIQVYMLNTERNWAVLRDGTGYVGRKLLGRNHRLPVDGRSLVAQAIHDNAAVIVQDTKADPNFLPNDMLPDTRSEIVIPLRSQGQVIGVLDIQHNVSNAFDESAVRLFQSMADQLAVTFENVNLFQSTRRRAVELETVAEVSAEATTNLEVRGLLEHVSELIKKRFDLYHAHIYLLNRSKDTLLLAGGAGEAGRAMVMEKRSIPVDAEQSLVARAAREHTGVIVNDVTENPDFLPHPLLPDTRAEMAIPMIIADEVVGVLDVQSDLVGRFTEDDIRIKTTLAAQIAVAVQNARSFETTERRALQLQTVARISAEATATLDVEKLVHDVAHSAAEGLDLYHIHIYLADASGRRLDLVAGTGRQACQHVGKDFWVKIEDVQNPVTWAAREREPRIDNHVTPEENVEFNPFLTETRSQLALPMVVGNKLVGVLEIHSDEYDAFDQTDIAIHTVLADQIATAVQNARSFELTRKRALELQTVAEVSTQASTTLNTEALLVNVSNLVKKRFNLYHAHIYVVDEEGENLVLAGGAGEAGAVMVAAGRSIPLSAQQSLVARAAREQNGVIVNNVRKDPNFLPNPLLPETRSEMAIPMIVGDEVVGVLDVQSSEVDHFTVDDIRIKTTLASQVAVAIQNARSFEEVEEARQEISRVYNTSLDMLGSADFEGFFTILNPAWEQTLGWSLDELMAEPFISFVHPDDVESTNQAAAELFSGEDVVAFENRYRAKDGSYRWLSWRSAADMETQAIHFVARDVTEQKSVQDQILRQSAIIENSDDFIALTDMDGVIEYINPGGLKMAGFDSLQAAIGTVIADYHSDEDTRRVLERGLPTLHRRGLWRTENQLKTQDGRLIPVEQTLFLIRDENGDPKNIATIMSDITERKEQEAELAEQQRTLDAILNNVPSGVFVVEAPSGKPILANLRAQELLGRGVAPDARDDELAEIYSAYLYGTDDLYPTEKLPIVRGMMGETSYVNDMEVRRPDGVSLLLEVAGAPIQDAEGNIVASVIAFQDITERNKQREEIAQRAIELQTVAEVGAEATSVLDVNLLLVDVSYLIKERFDLYHAHIYLLDEDGENLVLAGGAGEAGEVMVAEGRTIPLDAEKSIVARAARERTGVIVNDVRSDPDFLPHPMLPETRSEMAIPMIVGDEVIGVLDVQADVIDRFNENDIRVKSTLASQVAIAVQNARSFTNAVEQRQRSQLLAEINSALAKAADEKDILNALLGVATAENVSLMTLLYANTEEGATIPSSLDTVATMLSDGSMLPADYFPETHLTAEHYPILNSLFERPDELWISEYGFADPHYADIVKPDAPGSEEFERFVALPVHAGDTWYGAILFIWNEKVELSDAFLDITQAIMPNLASVVATRRAYLSAEEARRESERRAAELQTVADVSTTTTTILQLQDMLQSVADVTKERFDLYHAHIYLLDEETDSLVLAAGAGEPGRMMREAGHKIAMSREHSLVVQAAKTHKGVISNDVTADGNFLPNPLLPETRAEMAIPLVIGDQVIGVLDVQSVEVGRFTGEDVRVKTTLAAQIAVAIRNAQSYTELENQAEREREVAERLREVDRLKSQFLANMSHELRTPLNSIIGYSEVLLDGVDGELTEDAEEDIEAIHNSGKHLLSIINEILDLAKIEAGEMKLDCKPLNLIASVQEIIKTGQVLVKEKDVILEMVQETEVPEVYADAIRLRQILWNLVSNAIKFTEEGSVRVHINMHDETSVEVVVRDTGVGMTTDDVARIFERFSQVDGSSTRRAGGTGLGLTITRQLIEMHGGEIRVDSEPGVGSTFSFTIPMHMPEQAEPVQQKV
ncbi:MAG: GAF domain-containing protein [Chloroflexota bacterium]